VGFVGKFEVTNSTSEICLMPLRVYNTLTRQKEDFQTVVPGQVGMYLCGPTVYKPTHVGHMVGPVIFDAIKRYLTYLGYSVKFVINITDVDDKLIVRAAEKQTTVEKLAREMTQDYFDNLQTMGVDSVDLFPCATEHIPEMLDIIRRLIDRGYAYPLDGDVYFDVSRDEDYGALSHRSISEVLAGTRVEANERKRHPADFALWKSSKPGEPAWDSPWGKGRPGWHIECSAMSMKYLGETLDIHGGGLDLMFPHHENELAQSESCTGQKFSRYWLHNGLMQAGKSSGKVGGAHSRLGDAEPDRAAQEAGKLAGSKGAASVKELFARHSPETVRFFLLATHYRSPIDFSDENIAEKGKSLDGFYRLFETYQRIAGKDFYELKVPTLRTMTTSLAAEPATFTAELMRLRDRFFDAMDDDFNTGGATAILFDIRSAINGFIQEQKLETSGKANASLVFALTGAVTLLKELASLLGVFLRPLPKKAAGADDQFTTELMGLVLELRAEARATKNWPMSDKIRDRLKALKIVVEDRPDGATWRREG
jgi:cysteinyl-tRNA synthetase